MAKVRYSKYAYTHSMLVDAAYKWAENKGGCSVVFKEMKTIVEEIPDVIGFGGTVHSLLIEVKISRIDFKREMRSKSFRIQPERGMGTHRLMMCPAGMLKLEELPPKWGLLEVDSKGKITLSYRPNPEWPTAVFLSSWHAQPCNEKAERLYMLSALRRLKQMGRIEPEFGRIKQVEKIKTEQLSWLEALTE